MVAETLAQTPPGPWLSFWRAFRENRGAVVGFCLVCFIILCAIFADVLAPYDPLEQFRDATKRPPFWVEGGSWTYPLGTDPLGRDMLSRILHGSRISLFIGLAVMLVTAVLGIFLGMIAAFKGGIIDVAVMSVLPLTGWEMRPALSVMVTVTSLPGFAGSISKLCDNWPGVQTT